jgi:hypothetical protein
MTGLGEAVVATIVIVIAGEATHRLVAKFLDWIQDHWPTIWEKYCEGWDALIAYFRRVWWRITGRRVPVAA